MKKILLMLITSGILCIGAFHHAWAQKQNDKVFIGTTSRLLNQLVAKESSANGKTAFNDISIAVDHKTVLTVAANVKKQKGNTNSFIGEVKSQENSSFFLSITGTKAEGRIILKNKKLAYEISSDEEGNVYVQHIDIDKVLCVDFKELPLAQRSKKRSSQRNAINPATSNVYALQSLPGSSFVVYIDFDGEYFGNTGWNGGGVIEALPSGMSDADILEAWEITSEDYRAFNLNITTDVNAFNNALPGKRIRCVITPTNTAGPGYGGIAYIGSFNWSVYEEPCWSFTSGVGTGGKNVGEVCSHEIGHTLFLGHDGRTDPSETYYAGNNGWAPIMGVGYYENLVQFSRGEYLNANNLEDDITIIASQNGFYFREDDHDDNTTGATGLILQSDDVLATENNGVISQRSDVDFFNFTTSGGQINLSFNAAPRHGNLDILVKLYDQNLNLIDRQDQDGFNVTLSNTLKAGLYYVSIDGTGNGDPLVSGYTDYSSLGSYTISGTIPQSKNNNYPTVAITSPINNQQFEFPGNVTIVVSASDSDGSIAKVEFYNSTHKLGEAITAPYSYQWNNIPSGSFALIAKATDNKGAVTTSEEVIIVINSGDNCLSTPAWSSSKIFDVPGQRISFLGKIFENKWWTQNDQPNEASQWGVWKYIGPCGSSNLNLRPSVSFIAPLNPYFQAGNNTLVIAAASDVDGTIQKVDFYENDQFISSSTTAPYFINKNNIHSGLHNIKVIATDNLGATSDPAYLILTVDALPTFLSPLANTDYPYAGALNLELNANGGESRIAKVEYFFSDMSNKIGEAYSTPYSLTYSPLPNGTSSQGNYLPIVAKITYEQGGIVVIDTYIHIVNTVQLNLCTNLSTYSENNDYQAGSTVKSNDRIYECKPWPYSGWCNSAAIAYGPGTGTVWQDAWMDKGSCTVNAKHQSLSSNLAEAITVFPNPTTEAVQLDFGNADYTVASVSVFDAFGNMVIKDVEVNRHESLDLSLLTKGLYNLQISVNDEMTYRKIIKY
ncbi:MAG: T9SS type A sorting domain-containing protein [Cytophagaceae bacterium]|nr:T9SS type A sorting domain-containing protein [Cytophagaceae bacterium]